MRMKNVFECWARLSLVLRIFIGLVIGVVLGLFVPKVAFISVFGKLFVGALKAIAPIISIRPRRSFRFQYERPASVWAIPHFNRALYADDDYCGIVRHIRKYDFPVET